MRNQPIKNLLATLICLLSAQNSAFGNDETSNVARLEGEKIEKSSKKFAVGSKIGIPGIGLEFRYKINDQFYFRPGFNYFKRKSKSHDNG